MRAADTNVLVRLIVADDDRQTAAARDFVDGGVWISHIALVELVWVLESVYDRPAKAIANAIEQLLEHQHVTLQDGEVVAAALGQFRRRPSIGFSDCLLLEVARKAGHLPLGTFDRDLGKLDGAQSL